MATKVIYFTVYGNEEQAEFRADDNPEDVKGEWLDPNRRGTWIWISRVQCPGFSNSLVMTILVDLHQLEVCLSPTLKK